MRKPLNASLIEIPILESRLIMTAFDHVKDELVGGVIISHQFKY